MKNKSMLGRKIGVASEKAGRFCAFAKSKSAFAAMCFLCFALPLYARTPYRIHGEVSVGADAELYEYAGIALTFYNASGRTVRRFSVVVFLSGSDRESPFTEGNCITLECDDCVAPYAAVNAKFRLDDYIFEAPDEAYRIDFLYVSKIEYDDSGIWEDPYGIYAK